MRVVGHFSPLPILLTNPTRTLELLDDTFLLGQEILLIRRAVEVA